MSELSEITLDEARDEMNQHEYEIHIEQFNQKIVKTIFANSAKEAVEKYRMYHLGKIIKVTHVISPIEFRSITETNFIICPTCKYRCLKSETKRIVEENVKTLTGRVLCPNCLNEGTYIRTITDITNVDWS
jgi:hypothetical protein